MRFVRPVVLVAALLATAAVPAIAHVGDDVADYAWVRPPAGVTDAPTAEGRVATIKPDLYLVDRAELWTPERQAVVAVRGGAAVDVAIAPFDPARWPAPPGGEAAGNAYEVEVSGDVPAEVTLTSPWPISGVARWDGDTWQVAPIAGNDLATVPWDGPGPYLALAARTDGHTSAVAALVHDPFRATLLALGTTGLLLGLHRRRTGRRAAPNRESSE